MRYPKTVIGIRTHQWTDAEQNLYQELQDYFDNQDIFVVVDETKNTLELAQGIQKISLNKVYLQKSEVLDNHPHKLGWLCGDYFYYALADGVNADYYWLIEPDVAFTFKNVSEFFKKFQTARQDALLHNFSKAPDSWAWTHRARIIDNDVYQAFFPLSRLSFKAVSACKQERQAVTAYFSEHKIDLNNFPNDESLVATSLMKHNLSVEKLSAYWPDSFRYFSYRNAILGEGAKQLLPFNQVIHPYREAEHLGDWLANRLEKFLVDESFLGEIKRSVFADDEIEGILVRFQQRMSMSIRPKLEYWSAYKTAFAKIQKKFDEIANAHHQNVSYKSWIWRGNTLVLDATIYLNDADEQIQALEYMFDHGNVSCNMFTRKGDGRFIEILQSSYPHLQVVERKISFMSYSESSGVLDVELDRVLHIFIETLNKMID